VDRTPHRLLSLILLVAVALVAIQGCSPAPKGGTGGDLENIPWKLSSYSVSGVMTEVPKTAGVYAEFKGGKVAGQAVNSYSGTYESKDDGSLTIGQIQSTLMAGPPELMAVETAYFAALQETASYTSDGSKLTLFDKDGKELLVFLKSEVSLIGSWTVTGYNNGKQAVVSVISTSTLTMDFGEGGALTGNGGVNNYTAKYETTGSGEITISEVASTKMAGPEDLMAQEQQFFTALSASKTYQLRGETLEMRDLSGELQVTAKRGK
jgi:heat shock protein HslJ